MSFVIFILIQHGSDVASYALIDMSLYLTILPFEILNVVIDVNLYFSILSFEILYMPWNI